MEALSLDVHLRAMTPQPNITMMPQPLTVYSDINGRRAPPSPDTTSPEPWRSFYNYGELREAAHPGYPKMAAFYTQWPNNGTFRLFDYANWRLLQFYETKLSYLLDQLHNLDDAESKAIHGSQTSKLPFDKKIFEDCYSTDPDNPYLPKTSATDDDPMQDEFNQLRENIFAHLGSISTRHHELVGWMQRASTLPRVPRDPNADLFKAAQEICGLNGEAIEHLKAIGDTAYINHDAVVAQFDRHGRSVSPWIRRILPCLFTKNPLPDVEKGSLAYDTIRVDRFRKLHKTARTLSGTLLGSLLVLIPTGIIYLGGLSRPLSFAVVVVFDVICAVTLLLIEDRFGHAIVGTVAYIAVLATFLANVT
ncbi:hypothetical protein F4808DRAFT_460281 [Astrocystis sublimbata]|nr:hypothetical protein F4808DRAFT_460281 [Astrocystis sublimbata]